MRALLEQAADFKTKPDQAPALHKWLIKQCDKQK